MTNVVEIVVTGKNLTKPEFDKAVADARMAGQKMGAGLSDEMGAQVKKDLPAKVEKPLEESGKRGGQKAGQAAAGGISPLITGAFVAAASVGPAAILGATALAVIGAGALITKGNGDLAASYKNLGAHASDAIMQATAPLIPQLQASVAILDRGVATIGPELRDVFAAVAPDATALTSGLVSLVSNTLPGMASGLRAIAPFAQSLAIDFGKIGSGLGGFFQGLGTGAAGGITGFNALADVLKELLTDVGTIVGSLANGLGPALHDVGDIAIPVARGLANVVSAIPPAVIRDAADATALLFATFKIGAIAGVVAEGTTFTGFIRGLIPAEEGLAAANAGLAASFEVLLGPIGAVLAALPLLTSQAGSLSLVNADLKGKTVDLGISVSDYTAKLKQAGDGSRDAQQAIDMLTGTLKDQKNAGADVSGQLGEIDQSLASLFTSDKTAAANEYKAVLGDLGLNVQQGAAQFPLYAKASAQVAMAAQQSVPVLDSFSTALVAAAGAAGDSAKQNATATLAALGLTDGTSNLTTGLYNALQAFTGASGAASAYKSSLDALYNKYADYSQAQATFTEQLNSAAKALTHGKDAVDLNSDAGAKNFTVLHQLANANEQVAESFINQGGSVQEANKKLQAGALAIDNMARKAGFSADQVAQLNRELYGTANIKDIRVNVDADTSGALARVRNLINTINGSSAYVQVYANTSNPSGGRALLASGGISGGHAQFAAAGGPRSGFTWVGEHGPELIPLPAGTRVHSNPDSMRMAAEAASGGGGVQSLRVEFVGGASDPLWELLRQHIRFTAGNGPNAVQTALGQH